jgi:hypothetical protein
MSFLKSSTTTLGKAFKALVWATTIKVANNDCILPFACSINYIRRENNDNFEDAQGIYVRNTCINNANGIKSQ